MNLRLFNSNDCSLSVSESTHPLINLGWESHLLKGSFAGHFHLFLYRNSPCIVSGRFQIPWKEINFKEVDHESIAYVRRRSGGGTVYHDLGNWNFCFIHKTRELQRESNLEEIIKVLASLGVTVETNERYDLVFNSADSKGKLKISGSAFKQTKNLSLHHGTLLMEANLSSLKGSLGKPQEWEFEGKGIASVPSPVTNLFDHFKQFSFEDWASAWQKYLVKNSIEEEINLLEHREVMAEANDLGNWSWRWGETPHHKIYWKGHPNAPSKNYWIEIKKGIVAQHCLENEQLELQGLKVCSLDKEEAQSLLKNCETFEKEQLLPLMTNKMRLSLI